ncbi:hypothetical protein N7526_006348 [Penicillium atrosanguineum]|nr:hypothetical protein N7526_006348 [Penicillium atrosanguineum]
MSAKDLTAMFKDDTFISLYKTGEKITGTFVKLLIDQSGIFAESRAQPDRPLVVLDSACGTGVVSSILHHGLDDRAREQWKLTCGDISEGMLNYTRARVEEEGWRNIEVKIVDAQKTELPSTHFTHVFTAFAFQLVPQHQAVLDESLRILQPGGTTAFTTWIEPGWESIMEKAIKTLPGNLPFPTSEEFLAALGEGQWGSVPWIKSQLQQRGFVDIEVKAVTKRIQLTPKEMLEPCMMMFPLITKRFWSAEQREQHEAKVRPALAQYLEDSYGKDGVVPMDWVAILATARKAC